MRLARPATMLACLVAVASGLAGTPEAARAAYSGGNGLVAFAGRRNGTLEIYATTADGGRTRRLTNNSAVDDAPAWSRDGRRIAFSSLRDGNSEIYVMNGSGSTQTRLTDDPGHDADPAWTTDGRIVFASDRDGDFEIYSMFDDGSIVTMLTDSPGNDRHPAWSRDDKHVVFTSTRDGNQEIYLLSFESVYVTEEVRLTVDPAADHSPAFSPDGTRIAFVSDRDGNDEIYAMNLDGSGLTRLTTGLEPDLAPQWSPDGARIVFQRNVGSSADLWTMAPDGSDQEALTVGLAMDAEPDWQPVAAGDNSTAVVDAGGAVGSDSSMALTEGGLPVVSYLDETNDALKVASCGDPNCDPLAATVATPDAGGVGGDTSLVLTASGTPIVSYLWGNLNEPTGDLRILHCGNARCTLGNTITTPDARGVTGIASSLMLDPDGNPVVSYVDLRGRLWVLRCGEPTCLSGNTIGQVDNHAFTYGTAVALDADGVPLVAYVGQEHLRLAHCGDPACLTGAGSAVLSDTGSSGWQGGVSMVLDAAGNPVISFFSWDLLDVNSELWMVHCGDPECSLAVTPMLIDDNGWAGAKSSIALDAAGNPVISYSAGGVDLTVVTCLDPTCASGHTYAAADLLKYPGYDSSLVLDADGNPVVSHWVTRLNDLRVLHCSTPDCR